MAIQVPTVKRVAPVEEPSAGRIDARGLPDGTRAMSQVSNALLGFGKEAMSLQTRAEDEAIDTEKTKASVELESFYRKKMYGGDGQLGLKHQEGDPTVLYKDFDSELEAEFKRLTTNENYDSRMIDGVTKGLTDTMNRIQLQKLQEYGNQQAKYENNVTNSAIDLEKGNLVNASSSIRPDEPDSMAPFDAAVGRIRDLRLKNGIKTGNVVPDENGNQYYVADDGKVNKVKISPITDYELKKDLSDGIYNAMDNLIKTGNLEGAKTLREKYGDYLEPIKKKSIADDFEKADIKAQAYSAVENVRAKGAEGIDAEFSKLKPEIRDEAYKILDDRQRRQEQIKARQSKSNYDLIANQVIKRMNSDNPYAGPTELEADPIFRNAINRVTDPKQKQALYNLVQAPKNTPDSVRGTMQNLIFGDLKDADGNILDISDMDPATFAQYKAGMTRADQKHYDSIYEKMRSETGAQERARYKSAGKELTDQLISVGYIQRDDFNRISGVDEAKMIQARNELIDYLDKNGSGPMSPKELKDYVRQFAISKKTGEAFKPILPQRFQGTKQTQQDQNPPPRNDNTKLIKGKTRVQWNQEYLRQKKKPASDAELTAFIKSQE